MLTNPSVTSLLIDKAEDDNLFVDVSFQNKSLSRITIPLIKSPLKHNLIAVNLHKTIIPPIYKLNKSNFAQKKYKLLTQSNHVQRKMTQYHINTPTDRCSLLNERSEMKR